MDPDVFSFIGVMATIAGFIFVITMTWGLAQRLGITRRTRHDCNCLAGDHEELVMLRERVSDLEYANRRVEELEERVDFAERMLAGARQVDRVGEPTEPTNTVP